MSVSKILNTDGTYTARNNYFGAYVAFHDSCYDYDDNSTYVIAEKTDGSLTLIRTQDDGGTFEDLGLVGVTPTVTAPDRGETTRVVGSYLIGTLVAGGGNISFCTHNAGTLSYNHTHSLSAPFTSSWASTTTNYGVISRCRFGALYLELNHSGIFSDETALYETLTSRHTRAGTQSYGGSIRLVPDGTVRALAGGYMLNSSDGISWVQTTLSVPAGYSPTTDKQPGAGAVHSPVMSISAFHAKSATYNGMVLTTVAATGVQDAEGIGEASKANSPTNIALSISYDSFSDTFFATTRHKTTSALSYWKYTVVNNTPPLGQDWSLVTTEGAPSDTSDSPTQSVVMTVVV